MVSNPDLLVSKLLDNSIISVTVDKTYRKETYAMGCPELAKNLYLSKQANSASSILQSLNDHGLINCSSEVLQSTSAFGQGVGAQDTCSCLVASAMAASLAKAKPEQNSCKSAKNISSQIAQ